MSTPIICCLFFLGGCLFLLAKTQTSKIKYSFKLPQRDSVSFRPYQFSGSYKKSVLSFSIKFKNDFLLSKNGQSLMSASVEANYKPNGLRNVLFRDGRNKPFDLPCMEALREASGLVISIKYDHQKMDCHTTLIGLRMDHNDSTQLN